MIFLSQLTYSDDTYPHKTIVFAACIVGGMDMVSQAMMLAKKPHVIIATPGRLVDHLENTKGFNLRSLKYLVSAVLFIYDLFLMYGQTEHNCGVRTLYICFPLFALFMFEINCQLCWPVYCIDRWGGGAHKKHLFASELESNV